MQLELHIRHINHHHVLKMFCVPAACDHADGILPDTSSPPPAAPQGLNGHMRSTSGVDATNPIMTDSSASPEVTHLACCTACDLLACVYVSCHGFIWLLVCLCTCLCRSSSVCVCLHCVSPFSPFVRLSAHLCVCRCICVQARLEVRHCLLHIGQPDISVMHYCKT